MSKQNETAVFWKGEQIGVVTGDWFLEMFNRSAVWKPADRGVAERLEVAQEEQGDIYLQIDGETFRFGMIDGDEISVFHGEAQ